MPVSHVVVDDCGKCSESSSSPESRFDTSSKSDESSCDTASVCSIPPITDTALTLDHALNTGENEANGCKILSV